jgi:hypothetical protein
MSCQFAYGLQLKKKPGSLWKRCRAKNEQKFIGTCVVKQLSVDAATLRVAFVVCIHLVSRSFF